MSISTKQLEQYIKELTRGYPKGCRNSVDVYEIPVSVEYPPGTYAVRLSNEFMIDKKVIQAGESKITDSIMIQMKQSIENSDMFQMLASDLIDKLANLEAENLTLKNQLEKLKPYEQHFELEYKLRHGNKDD